MSLSFNIAIDGHSSCGKSTIAKSVASKYCMRYIDTGAMYRAVTLYCMKNGIIKEKVINHYNLLSCLNEILIDFRFNPLTRKSETILNGENVEGFIRGIDVSDNVSIIAQVKEVRKKLILLQQEIGKSKNIVMDGRDIGTKVFPNAKLKLFITAGVDIRAKRRYEELINSGSNVSFDKILNNLNERDMHDVNRKINPLIKASDAILIDNSNLSLKEQNILVEKLINSIK
jgi:cytidylate kinase